MGHGRVNGWEGGRFKVIIWGGKPQKDWGHFIGQFSSCTAVFKIYFKS